MLRRCSAGQPRRFFRLLLRGSIGAIEDSPIAQPLEPVDDELAQGITLNAYDAEHTKRQSDEA